MDDSYNLVDVVGPYQEKNEAKQACYMLQGPGIELMKWI